MGGEQALIGNFLPIPEMPRVPSPPFLPHAIESILLTRATFSANFSQFNRNSDAPIPALFKDVYNLPIRLIAILFVSYYRYAILLYIYIYTLKFNPL